MQRMSRPSLTDLRGSPRGGVPWSPREEADSYIVTTLTAKEKDICVSPINSQTNETTGPKNRVPGNLIYGRAEGRGRGGGGGGLIKPWC